MIIRILQSAAVVAFLTAAPLAAQDDAIAAVQTLSGKAAIDRMIGNTLVVRVALNPEQYGEGRVFLRPDRTAKWVTIEKNAQPVEVKWSIDEKGRLCLSDFPDPSISDDCALMEIRGEEVFLTTVVDERRSEGELIIRLVNGNPFGY